MVYTWYVESESIRCTVGQLMELPEESEFTDEQIRTYVDEACEVARDVDHVAEWQFELGPSFLDEHPAAILFVTPGAYYACLDVIAELEGWD